MSQRIRVLTIDDNEIDREIITRALAKSRLSIDHVAVESFVQAKSLLDDEIFDCMLLDYQLPPTNGIEILNSLSAKENLPAVVMLTGMGDERIAVEAMKSGVHEYINKNAMTVHSITDAIESAITEKQSLREKSLHQDELEKMSFYDHLTGLANRNLFFNRLNEQTKISRRHNQSFCVILMDLNGFKMINDTMGHASGDLLLIEVSRRLIELSRDSDTVARLGGDEFIFLLPDSCDCGGASTVARKVIESISRPVEIEGHNVSVGASLGIAMFPEHGSDPHTLVRHADNAMYNAKRNKLGYATYSTSETDNLSNKLSIELPQILLSDNMILHYQPKVNLSDGQFCGAEVLIRWQHPVLGLLPPMEFIPIAEKSLIIRELSYKLIDEALMQHAKWQTRGLHIPLSINLSSRMLADCDLAANIESLRRKHQIDASSIIFEITETALITEPQRARKILEQLVSDGFLISIDDFGTGYSSLSYLRDFPIHEIKIDKSFVQSVQEDIRNSYIIEAIVGLAKAFGTTSVAEGIENNKLWEHLRDMGCDIGQGFYISKPVNAYDFELWFQSQIKTSIEQVKLIASHIS